MVILKIDGKVNGSSLVELTVAMVIMVLVFGVALLINLNVTGQGTTLRQLHYNILLQDYAARTKSEKSFLDEKVELEEVTIEKEVIPYESNSQLVLLHLKIIRKEDSRLLKQHRELIYLPHEEN